jgi:hypothetical protein
MVTKIGYVSMHPKQYKITAKYIGCLMYLYIPEVTKELPFFNSGKMFKRLRSPIFMTDNTPKIAEKEINNRGTNEILCKFLFNKTVKNAIKRNCNNTKINDLLLGIPTYSISNPYL